MNYKLSYIVSIILILVSIYFTYLHFYPHTIVSKKYSVNSPTTMFLTERTNPSIYACTLPGLVGIVLFVTVKLKERKKGKNKK